jgi:hypothetical protein
MKTYTSAALIETQGNALGSGFDVHHPIRPEGPG